ncbi:hypothetical protein [Paenibacillus sp. FSL K6-2862]|uniref:hypothetical protein n=1 Tax=Paenibacillus sp. FSL K6-2862 TaxID=2921484 RepID=UPI0030F4EDB3
MGDFIKRWGLAASICFIVGLLLLDFSSGQKEITTESEVESLTQDPSQTNVMDWEVTKLSTEQFQERYSELTGERTSKEPINQEHECQKADTTEEQTPSIIMECYDAEYAANIALEEGISAQAGVLVQVREVRNGDMIRKEFRKVYENTGYLSSDDSSTSELVKNYVLGTLQDHSRLQLSFSGYVAHLQRQGEWEARNQRAKDPKHFSGSGFFQL